MTGSEPAVELVEAAQDVLPALVPAHLDIATVVCRCSAAVGTSEAVAQKFGSAISVVRTQMRSSPTRRAAVKSIPLPSRVVCHSITGISRNPSPRFRPAARAASRPSTVMLLLCRTAEWKWSMRFSYTCSQLHS
jgi:hypothetical protein